MCRMQPLYWSGEQPFDMPCLNLQSPYHPSVIYTLNSRVLYVTLKNPQSPTTLKAGNRRRAPHPRFHPPSLKTLQTP